ncbi:MULTISPECIES: SDR family oxidoreductase [unclassified Stenotrophomonas]|uniref:SDR family oxidoreductase n=1 Tax=unclassified Stenotrophomonas TaxID=196198 RepID=UPI000D16843C|nr:MULTISPECIES: SDR family oxidoreductase [unclassified Stenotrophomonas]PTA72737.1 oxidoreductase [Stenotrophomonas sp. Nf1]PTA82438.1 oxidoreductase [Stenotrophomonas sp. Nf4]
MANNVQSISHPAQQVAFVTGATGLLGNNLVRELLNAGFVVKALARSRKKAEQQLEGLPVEIVEGDMLEVASFAAALVGVDVVFHTAAYFRDSYNGGSHWDALYAANVSGTRNLLQAAYSAGVRRFVHTSSIAVLRGKPDQLINETMLRKESDADEYYRSKILSDREVLAFLKSHPDFWAAMVLPGWMHGPGDLGPTSAGQLVLDFMHGKLPGVPPGSVAIVDARDVARALILANQHGVRGDRYLAAGPRMSMSQVLAALEKVTGVKAPTRSIPLALLYPIGLVSEVKARLTGKPVQLSWAMVRALSRENGQSRFDPSKSARELGLRFRPLAETLRDEVEWFLANGKVAANTKLAARST